MCIRDRLVLELYALTKPKGRRFCWTILLVIHAALFTLVPFFGTVFLWLDGACNYLWGTALALLPLLIIPRLLEKECAALGVIGVPLCFLSGWTNENAACGMLAAALLLLADSAYRGKRTSVSAWLCLAAQEAGAAMMIQMCIRDRDGDKIIYIFGCQMKREGRLAGNKVVTLSLIHILKQMLWPLF